MRQWQRGMAVAVLGSFLAGSGLLADDRAFPFELKKKDQWLLPLGLGLAALGGAVHSGHGEITLEEILALDRNDINAFDRCATRNWSIAWDDRSDAARDVLIGSAVLVTAVPPLLGARWSEALTVAVMYTEAVALTGGVTYLTKAAAARNRPYLYNTDLTPEERLGAQDDPKSAFFSGHTSLAFASAAFISRVFTETHGPSVWSTVVWGSSLSLAALTGFARVKAGAHYPTDVIAGAAVGFAIGYLVPALHKKPWSDRLTVAAGPGLIRIALRF